MPARRLPLWAAALAAALVLAAAVSASANKLEVRPQAIRSVWSGAGHQLTFIAGGVNIICDTTMEGSFHSRTFPKAVGLLVGYITAAMTEKPTCSGGTMLWLNGIETTTNKLPWHIQYRSFEGALPMITGVRFGFSNMSFRLTARFGGMNGVQCLYESTAAAQAVFIFKLNMANGIVSALQPEEAVSVPPGAGNGILCPASATVRGISNTVTKLAETESVIFRLIT
jgi:hypothetical protein